MELSESPMAESGKEETERQKWRGRNGKAEMERQKWKGRNGKAAETSVPAALLS